jgi:hypothetical protein
MQFGLASDSFNLYDNMSTTYIIWTIMLKIYNFLPWMRIKSPNLMLSLIIPKLLDPKKNIDIYLQPLVDNLKNLWNKDIRVYNASKKKAFQLHATLLWIINNFPIYRKLSR